MTSTARQQVDEIRSLLAGRPGYLVGSSVAGAIYDRDFSDVDVFVPSVAALSSITQFLLSSHAVLDAQEERKWSRWNDYGLGDWSTNSIKIETLSGIEVNVVYKVVNKTPLTTLHGVLGSFDFGYVAMGYDLKDNTFHDGREFWFGKGCDFNHLGMLPDRARQWRNASLSRYTGVRQGERFAKFARRGYDMKPSIDALVTGYRCTAAHYQTKDDPEYQVYAPLYLELANLIEAYDIDALLYAYQGLQKHDPVTSLSARLP